MYFQKKNPNIKNFRKKIRNFRKKNPNIRKRPQIPKEVPRRMKNAEHIKISDFKSYYKAKVSKQYCTDIKRNT